MDQRRSFSLYFSTAVAIVALVIAGIAVSVSNRSSTVAAGAEVTTVEVTLSEFALTPTDITVPPGTVRFVVTNTGTLEHNFEVKGKGATRNLKAGESQTLELDLDAGHYDTVCAVPGHEGSGMRGMVMVVEGATAGGEASPPTSMSWQEMDAMMDEGVNTFLRVNGLAEPKVDLKDQGKETADLPPTVLADGTKEFDLTTKIVDWEVEPGKNVKAWTYNGVVPGPTIKVELGDKVRIVVHNELPESTACTSTASRCPTPWTGARHHPAAHQAGRPPSPTSSSLQGPAVGMYHSHQNAATRCPTGWRRLPRRRAAGAGRVCRPGITDDAQRRRHHRVLTQRQVVPGHRPVHRAKLGDYDHGPLPQRGCMAHPMHLPRHIQQ